ncbi:MAG: hypothetical protein E6Q76_14370 [Rhizobium sp.]|nr:MAG: hypothetical protein E6Q76_14370 [Rhizobium sp.]
MSSNIPKQPARASARGTLFREGHDGRLRPGEYWRARKDAKFYEIREWGGQEEKVRVYTADAGEVLLLADVRVDGPADQQHDHTVILMTPPSDGDAREVRMLVHDFYDHFEPALDGEKTREEQVAEINRRIKAISADIERAQANPDYLNAQVHKDLALEQKAKAVGDADLLPALPSDLSLVNVLNAEMPSLATSLSDGGVAGQINVLIDTVTSAQKLAVAQGEWFGERTKALSGAVAELTPYYVEKANLAIARTRSSVKRAAVLLDSVRTLSLFTGEDVTCEKVVDGAAAPVGTPVHLYQRKLWADEELSYLSQYVEGEVDSRNLDRFFDELRKNPPLLDLFIPAQRGIVLVGASRQFRDIGHPLLSAMLEKQNQRGFLLVRDGGNVYFVVSPIEGHLDTDRLFPESDIDGAVFGGVDGSRITPEDLRWTDRVDHLKTLVVMYRRFAVVLAGLISRGAFFEGVDFHALFSAQAGERIFHLVRDASGEGVIGRQAESLKDYVRRANEGFRKGMRLLVDWHSAVNESSAPSVFRYNHHSRRSEPFMRPSEDFSVATVNHSDDSLFVMAPLRNNYRLTERRVRVTLHKNGQWLVPFLSYLCVDRVEPGTLDRLMASRDERKDFMSFMGLFRAARNLATQREAEQAEIRAYLLQHLADAGLCSLDDARQIVTESLASWCAEFGHPPKIGDKACGRLLDRVFRLTGKGRISVPDVEAYCRERGITPLRLSLANADKHWLYTVPSAPDDRATQQVEVDRIRLKSTPTGVSGGATTSVLLRGNVPAETILHQWDDCTDWIVDGSPKISLARKQALIKGIERSSRLALSLLGSRISEDRVPFVFDAYRKGYDAAQRGGLVPGLTIAAPIGLVDVGRSVYVAVLEEGLWSCLHRNLPEAAWQEISKRHISVFRNKEHGRTVVTEGHSSDLSNIRLCLVKTNQYDPSLIVRHAWWGVRCCRVLPLRKGERVGTAELDIPLGLAHLALTRGSTDDSYQFTERIRCEGLWLASTVNLDVSEPLVSAVINASA